jgi:lantibiotic leader peptide-processing serine protease
LKRIIVCGLAVVAMAVAAPAALGSTYVVLYKQQAVGTDTSASIQKAGGTLVYAYPQIGVVIARSDSASFRDNLLKDSRVENASSTDGYGMQVDGTPAPQAPDEGGGPSESLPNSPAADSAEPLYPLQWDMQQIHTSEAHAITGGSPAVLAGDIDTGMDFAHPDLAPNADVADSANCLSGAPVPGLAAQDDNGHGTHTAGTIAAAANGFGMVGVAPNVSIAAIKAGNADGYFFPEAVICAFVWAGTHHMDVTNNSYYADPFLYNCRNDPVQRAIWKAEQRAIQFAMDQGVTVVSAEGNESDDLSHPTEDNTSPDNGTPVDRAVTNACVVIPVEIPGVIGVTATGDFQQTDGDSDATDYLKSYYSSYGVSAADVTAPGGDFYWGRSARATNGLVLSTWPAYIPCGRNVQVPTGNPTYPIAWYCYLQGTSMASPHVAGVAALVVSRYGDLKTPQNGTMRPDQVKAYIDQTADPQPCPTAFPLAAPGTSRAGQPYLSYLNALSGAVQSCQGGPGHNSWYGNGRADAYNAVTKTSGEQANDEPTP